MQIYTDNELQNMTLGELRDAFKRAAECGIDDDFATFFWREVSRARNMSDEWSMQRVVNLLENCKRQKGRKYDTAAHKADGSNVASYQKLLLAFEYNELEHAIAYLCSHFDVTRKSKPYVIKEI